MEQLPTAIQRFMEGMETGDWQGMEQHLAPDVLYDGSMPGWRAQFEGPARVTQEYRQEWTGRHPWHVVEQHVTQADDVVVVDFEAHGTSVGAGAHASTSEVIRMANIFRLQDGRIAEHRYYCCGEWDETTVRRIRAEAPKVDRRRALA